MASIHHQTSAGAFLGLEWTGPHRASSPPGADRVGLLGACRVPRLPELASCVGRCVQLSDCSADFPSAASSQPTSRCQARNCRLRQCDQWNALATEPRQCPCRTVRPTVSKARTRKCPCLRSTGTHRMSCSSSDSSSHSRLCRPCFRRVRAVLVFFSFLNNITMSRCVHPPGGLLWH